VHDVQWVLPNMDPESFEGRCAAAGGYLSAHADRTCWTPKNDNMQDFNVSPCTGVCADRAMQDSPPGNWLHALYDSPSDGYPYHVELKNTFCHSSGGVGGGTCNSWKGSAPVCLAGTYYHSTESDQSCWSVDADPRIEEPTRKGQRLCPCQAP
jgi:hypothetical protein